MPDRDIDKLLGQEARVRRVSRMIPASGSLSATLRHDIRKAVEAYMARKRFSQKDLAEAIGTSATYVNNLFTNAASLPETTQDWLWRDLNNMLDREARAEESQRPDDFVPTIKTAERLFDVVTNLTQRADMATATGPAGIGKSKTIEAITAEIPTAVAITAGYDTTTPKRLLRSIYAALTRRRKHGRLDIDMEEVVEKLRMPPRVKSRNVLIIDQAHELLHSKGVFRTLMELHDRAQCSILLVGTRDIKSYVATDDDPEFGQLSSRVGMRVELAHELIHSLRGTGKRSDAKCFTVADIRKLFAAGKLKLHADVARMLAEIANTRRGTLRRVVRLYAWAETAARNAGSDTILVKHLEQAAAVVEEDAELPAGVEGGQEEPAAAAAG
jgi:DNA transposition AAA+ family ATPase